MDHRNYHFVLVTSGLGTAHGGIGVVSEMMLSAVEGDCRVSVWKHPVGLPRTLRISLLAARALAGGLKHPDFIFYEHVHLAAIHSTLPRLSGIPYGVFLHGIEVWEPLVGKRREALLRANLLLANSHSTVEETRTVNPWLPEVQVTLLGVPRRTQHAIPGNLPPQALIVGRLASAERLKGHDVVLDAWGEITRTVPQAKLVIAGDGNDRARLQKRVAQEKLKGVEFVGRITDRERDELYLRSRLLFYISRQEGFGLAAAEAGAAGIPMMGLSGTVMEELFPKGHGAVLVGDLHPHTIAEAAVPVLTRADLANSLGQAAKARVEQCFTDEHFKKRFREQIKPFLVSVNTAAAG